VYIPSQARIKKVSLSVIGCSMKSGEFDMAWSASLSTGFCLSSRSPIALDNACVPLTLLSNIIQHKASKSNEGMIRYLPASTVPPAAIMRAISFSSVGL